MQQETAACRLLLLAASCSLPGFLQCMHCRRNSCAEVQGLQTAEHETWHLHCSLVLALLHVQAHCCRCSTQELPHLPYNRCSGALSLFMLQLQLLLHLLCGQSLTCPALPLLLLLQLHHCVPLHRGMKCMRNILYCFPRTVTDMLAHCSSSRTTGQYTQATTLSAEWRKRQP